MDPDADIRERMEAIQKGLRRPWTSYRLTSKGRRLFRDYVACMARVVEEHS